MEILTHAIARAKAGESVALVTVTGVRGSAPRHLGTKMLVFADGRTHGTIGGGKVEQEVTRIGNQVAKGAPAQRFKTHLVPELAMCCGGSMEFYIEPVGPSLAALIEAIECMSARRPAVLVTRYDGSPKTVEFGDDFAHHKPAFSDDYAREPLWPRERAVLFGAGHVSRAIGPVAAGIDLEVVICDDDATGALSALEDAPWVTTRVTSFAVREVEAEIGRLGFGDYVLIVTRDHALDEVILEQLLPNQYLTYLGLIGSRGKVGGFRKRLSAKGVATPERWARLHAPIGLDIGAETPAEIAVAVGAQLVHVRRRGLHSALDYGEISPNPPNPHSAPGPSADSPESTDRD